MTRPFPLQTVLELMQTRAGEATRVPRGEVVAALRALLG